MQLYGLGARKEWCKISDFKVGDKVYFRLHGTSYIVESGTIIRFMYYHKKKHAAVSCDEVFGDYLLLPEHLYSTEAEVKAILRREFYNKVNEVKKDIHSLEDLLKFMYNNDLTDWSSSHINGWQTDWVSRVAVRELAKEICGIELGE